MTELDVIKTEAGQVFVRSRYNSHLMLGIFQFDGAVARKTLNGDWFEIDRVPEIVEKVTKPCTVKAYKLKDGYAPSEKMPETATPAFFYIDSDEPNPLLSFYEAVDVDQTEKREPVEFGLNLVAEIDGDWRPIKTEFDVRYSLVDQLQIEPVLLPSRPCKLTRAESYRIIRGHVKQHINLEWAEVTSDYDFCFTVAKRVRTTDPVEFEKCLNPGGRKLKYGKAFREFRKVEIFNIAPPDNSGNPYKGYPLCGNFHGKNYADLQNNISAFLAELMDFINEPVHDCLHCKGQGVYFPATAPAMPGE